MATKPPLGKIPLFFDYRNHRGEYSTRRIDGESVRFWFGKTEHHPDKQWFMGAWDLDKDSHRDFAANDIDNLAGASERMINIVQLLDAALPAAKQAPELRDHLEPVLVQFAEETGLVNFDSVSRDRIRLAARQFCNQHGQTRIGYAFLNEIRDRLTIGARR